MSALRAAVGDRAIGALAAIALVGALVAGWAVFTQAGPGPEGVYVENPTYDELWPMRLQAIAAFIAGPATIAAVGGCVGMVMVFAARLRTG